LGYQLSNASGQPLSQISSNPVADSVRDDSDDRFDLDIYFILVRFLADSEKIAMNHLKIWPLTTES